MSFSLVLGTTMDPFRSAIVVGWGNLSSALALDVGDIVGKIIFGWHDAKIVKNTVNTIMPKLRAGEMVGTAIQQAVKGAYFIVSSVRGHARMVSDPRGRFGGKTAQSAITDR
jgi:predicted dinucleotide-binding enzyme